MIEEYTRTQTRCDACGKVKEDPLAIAGHYDSGWRNIAGKDLCYVCAGMFDYKMIEFLTESGDIEKLLEEHINNTPDQLGFGITLLNGVYK